MSLIRWWRVKRAEKLLRTALRVPGRVLVPMVNLMAGDAAPVKNAVAVIESKGKTKPDW